ncbi:hypothetical protein WA158_006386 [Blastocystis sp. Blastoise]
MDLYYIYKQLHTATGVEISVSTHFINQYEENLAIATKNTLTIFKLLKIKTDDGIRHYMSIVGQYTLNATIVSMVSVPIASYTKSYIGHERDALFISFKGNFVDVVCFDEINGRLTTLNSYNFSKQAEGFGKVEDLNIMNDGSMTYPSQCCRLIYNSLFRCILLQITETQLVVITTKDQDPFIINLKEKGYIGDIVYYQFLNGFHVPVLALIQEELPCWTGSLYTRGNKTVCRFLCLDLYTQTYTQIYIKEGLPNDIYSMISLPAPLFGAILFSPSNLFYVSNNLFFYIPLNPLAKELFDNRDYLPHKDYSNTLDICLNKAIPLYLESANQLLVFNGNGDVYFLSLIHESSILLDIQLSDPFSANLIPYTVNSISSYGEQLIFIGSKLTDSILLSYDSATPSHPFTPLDCLDTYSPAVNIIPTPLKHAITVGTGVNNRGSLTSFSSSLPIATFHSMSKSNIYREVYTCYNIKKESIYLLLCEERKTTGYYLNKDNMKLIPSEQSPFELKKCTITAGTMFDGDLHYQLFTTGLRLIYNNECIHELLFAADISQGGLSAPNIFVERCVQDGAYIAILFSDNSIRIIQIDENTYIPTVIIFNNKHQSIITCISIYAEKPFSSTQLQQPTYNTHTFSNSHGDSTQITTSTPLAPMSDFILENEEDLYKEDINNLGNEPIMEIEPEIPKEEEEEEEESHSNVYFFIMHKNGTLETYSLPQMAFLFVYSDVHLFLPLLSPLVSSFKNNHGDGPENEDNDMYIDDMVCTSIGNKDIYELQHIIFFFHTNTGLYSLYTHVPYRKPHFSRVNIPATAPLLPLPWHHKIFTVFPNIDGEKGIFFGIQKGYMCILRRNIPCIIPISVPQSVYSLASLHMSTLVNGIVYLSPNIITNGNTNTTSGTQLILGSLSFPSFYLYSNSLLFPQRHFISSTPAVMTTLYTDASDINLIAVASTTLSRSLYHKESSQPSQIYSISIYNTNMYTLLNSIELQMNEKLYLYTYTTASLSLHLQKTFDGSVTNVGTCMKSLIISAGNTLQAYFIEGRDLRRVGYLEIGRYISSFSILGKYIFCSDIQNRVNLVELDLMSDTKDFILSQSSSFPGLCLHTEYTYIGTTPRFIASDNRGNIFIKHFFKPDGDVSSSEFHLPSPVTCLARVNCPPNPSLTPPDRMAPCLIGTKEGEIGIIYPIYEDLYSCLYALQQSILTNFPQLGNLNLELFREADTPVPSLYPSTAVILDYSVINQFFSLSSSIQSQIATSLKVSVDTICTYLTQINDGINSIF